MNHSIRLASGNTKMPTKFSRTPEQCISWDRSGYLSYLRVHHLALWLVPKKREKRSWGCNSVGEYTLNMCESLVPSQHCKTTTKEVWEQRRACRSDHMASSETRACPWSRPCWLRVLWSPDHQSRTRIPQAIRILVFFGSLQISKLCLKIILGFFWMAGWVKTTDMK